MSGPIERALLSVQAHTFDEHLPLEDILTALHDADYADRIFMRGVDAHPEGFSGPTQKPFSYDDYWHRNPGR